jgi:hypothetical protein
MAVRNDFTAGEVLAAADLNDTFASKLDLAGGKILQIVRATDSTDRSTTSTSFVDVTGMSVTISPQKNDSAVLLIAVFGANFFSSGSSPFLMRYQITDVSNNAISGATETLFGLLGVSYSTEIQMNTHQTLMAYATPATTSATTYKLRFRSNNAAHTNRVLNNSTSAGQMYAIEVSA